MNTKVIKSRTIIRTYVCTSLYNDTFNWKLNGISLTLLIAEKLNMYNPAEENAEIYFTITI